MAMFELIVPSDEIIKIFLDVRNESHSGAIKIFANQAKVDISSYKCVKNNNYATEDQNIKALTDKLMLPSASQDDYLAAVKKINSVYKTLMKKDEIELTAKNLFNKREEIFSMFDSKKYVDVVNFISCINHSGEQTGRYIYSFSTKFCSFIRPNDIPIFDSYASTLICKFLKNKDKRVSHENMGCYEYYKDMYDIFISEHKISSEHKYKDTDIFIWLYGKIIEEYWNHLGIIHYSSPYYKPSSNKN